MGILGGIFGRQEPLEPGFSKVQCCNAVTFGIWTAFADTDTLANIKASEGKRIAFTFFLMGVIGALCGAKEQSWDTAMGVLLFVHKALYEISDGEAAEMVESAESLMDAPNPQEIIDAGSRMMGEWAASNGGLNISDLYRQYVHRYVASVE